MPLAAPPSLHQHLDGPEAARRRDGERGAAPCPAGTAPAPLPSASSLTAACSDALETANLGSVSLTTRHGAAGGRGRAHGAAAAPGSRIPGPRSQVPAPSSSLHLVPWSFQLLWWPSAHPGLDTPSPRPAPPLKHSSFPFFFFFVLFFSPQTAFWDRKQEKQGRFYSCHGYGKIRHQDMPETRRRDTTGQPRLPLTSQPSAFPLVLSSKTKPINQLVLSNSEAGNASRLKGALESFSLALFLSFLALTERGVRLLQTPRAPSRSQPITQIPLGEEITSEP